jgi:hypothetical protein
MFLGTPLISITELDGDVLGLGCYGYLGLPMFRGGSFAGRYTALARALDLTGRFRGVLRHDQMC